MTNQHCLTTAEHRAATAYDEPHRVYHDRRHLDDCLSNLDEVADLADCDRRVLRWAILWHDAIYDPTRSDNEEASAALAERELITCGVQADQASEVARVILLTKGHRVDPDNRLGALLVSIDLSILGSDPAHYADYARDVRREYSHVPEGAWRAGRAAVLRNLLAADQLYPHPAFHARFEEQARLNIVAELNTLS